MLASIKAYLLRSPDEKKTAGADDLQVAVVALLIRAATADAKFGPEERATIRRLAAG
ncbi:MAG: hypothetical protein CVT73_23605, partial [Alphaproteobacteria bacterium HGW-Alphaproteobacteria-12]